MNSNLENKKIKVGFYPPLTFFFLKKIVLPSWAIEPHEMNKSGMNLVTTKFNAIMTFYRFCLGLRLDSYNF